MGSSYVSIGRNIGGEPMSEDRWAAFKAETVEAVERHAGPVVTVAEGVGMYEGTREGTLVVVGASYGGHALEVELGRLAARYEQDAIAHAFATPDFVPARVPVASVAVAARDEAGEVPGLLV